MLKNWLSRWATGAAPPPGRGFLSMLTRGAAEASALSAVAVGTTTTAPAVGGGTTGTEGARGGA
jgi:hypothetical protein